MSEYRLNNSTLFERTLFSVLNIKCALNLINDITDLNFRVYENTINYNWASNCRRYFMTTLCRECSEYSRDYRIPITAFYF